jgi:N-acyl-L-homoserine lactone synthetase
MRTSPLTDSGFIHPDGSPILGGEPLPNGENNTADFDDFSLGLQALQPNKARKGRRTIRSFVGITAIGPIITDADMHLQAGRLRAEVYIDDRHFLGPEHRLPDGTERDEDDGRSIHLAAVRTDGKTTASVLGTMRLIKKESADEPLPVEKLFKIPEAAVGSLEVSRFIAKNSNKRLQAATSLALMRAATFIGAYEGSPSAYAIIENPLYRYFKTIGLPFVEVADRRWLDEYQSTNLAVRLYPQELVPALREKDAQRPSELAVAPFFENGATTLGLGYLEDGFDRG